MTAPGAPSAPDDGAAPAARIPRFRHTAAAGLAYQVAASLYQLVVPAVVNRQFGERVLGLWMTAYSLFGLFLAADLGVPATLLTTLETTGERRETFNAAWIRSGLRWTMVYVSLPLLFVLLAPALPWSRWFGEEWPTAVGAPGPLMSWLMLLGVLSVFASLAQPICVGLHRGYQAYVVITAAYAVAIPVLLLAAWLRAPFFLLAALFVAPPLFGGAALWAWGVSRRWFQVARKAAPGDLRAFWAVAIQFLLTDVAMSLILRTPEAVLSRTHDFAVAGRYSVITRFPFLLNALLVAVLQPLWPSFGAAARAHDRRQVRALVRRAYGTALGLWVLFALAVFALGGWLVRKWLGSDVDDAARLLPFAVGLAFAQSLHYCTSLVLVGLGGRRQNLAISAMMLVAYAALTACLAPGHGAAGLFVTLILVYGAVGAPVSFVSGWRVLKRWSADAAQEGAP